VKAVLDKAMEIQTRPNLEGDAHRAERAKLVRQVIAENFLAGQMAQESIKDQWDKISAAQRREFEDLFTILFQDSYTRMVLNFLKKENIEYKGESSESGGMRVGTVILHTNEHIPVDYHLVQKSGRWLIRDVDIDGVSIVSNYTNTFRKVIGKGSFEDLLEKMRLQQKAIGENAGL
jgi:phospholipid transport system substrate-binding protein